MCGRQSLCCPLFPRCPRSCLFTTYQAMASSSPFTISRLSLKERNSTLDTRIKNSEAFPRIRDAEAKMALDDAAFHKRIEAKRLKKKKLEKQGRKLPELAPSPSKSVIRDDYFTEMVVNKDPSCSKYMPFDKVYYPKLFSDSPARHMPDSIDMVWLLGFQHMAELPPSDTRPDFS